MFVYQQDSAPAHHARDTIELLRHNTPLLLLTCGHLTHWTWTRLTMSSGQWCSSVCTRPECMTLTSCDSVLSPCGMNWNSALWMMPLINGDVDC